MKMKSRRSICHVFVKPVMAFALAVGAALTAPVKAPPVLVAMEPASQETVVPVLSPVSAVSASRSSPLQSVVTESTGITSPAHMQQTALPQSANESLVLVDPTMCVDALEEGAALPHECEQWADLKDVDFWAWFEAKALCDCDILVSVCELTGSSTYTVAELAASWGPVQIGPAVAVEVTVCEYDGCGGSTVHFDLEVS